MHNRKVFLMEVIALILMLALWVWFNSCYAEYCRRRGGTVIHGSSEGTMCIEGGMR